MRWLPKYGDILRKIRKKQGKKMEDLSDSNISTSTISNIEKGFDIVSEEKIKYLCKKLKITYFDIPKILEKDTKKEQLLITELMFIENLIDLGNPKKGLERLKSIKTESSCAMSLVEYLIGRAYILKKHPASARSHFQKSLKIIEQQKSDSNNICAANYNQLAKIAYYENDFELALKMTKIGVEKFQFDGPRDQLIYSLLVNKAIYLEKLDYLEQASQILQELWTQEEKIKHIEVLLNMYDLQATIFEKYKSFTEAISYAQKGYDIAHINKNSHRSVELLNSLGSIYLSNKQYEQAELCFASALSLSDQVKLKQLFLPIYVQLGKIYIDLNKLKEAENILETAIQDKNNQSNIIRYNQALITLGDCLYLQNEYERALQPYSKALQLAQKHSLLSQEHLILRNLCRCWKETDSRQYQIGLHRFFELDVRLSEGGEQA